MREEVEQLLPLIKAGKVPEVEIRHITEKLLSLIKEEASMGKELGELLGQLKRASKGEKYPAVIPWVKVGNGFLAIGHKPGGKISFSGLKESGTSAVVTLLKENEGAAAIGKQVRSLAIDWIWFPFSAAVLQDSNTIAQIHQLYTQLHTQINAGKKIYIHCSAGIHRTGMITYGFLRSMGMAQPDAFATLRSLREVTAAQVGEDRLLWGDQFYNPDAATK